MQERRIPVRVIDDLMREVIRWIEVNRPQDADREEAAEFVLSAAYSSVTIAGAACAGMQAFGGDITEAQFLDLAREAYRRTHLPDPAAA